MIHTKTQHIPATTREVETHRSCDICSATIKEQGVGDFDECKIERRKGAAWSGEGYHQLTEVDICGACFETKLVPWLESLGAKPRSTDESY